MTVGEMTATLIAEGIPEHLHGGILRYVDQGIRPGSFLSACIARQMEVAVLMAADTATAIAIPAITHWFMFHAPGDCSGSELVMEAWIHTKRAAREVSRRQIGKE
jgi:hypothetical protein